MLNLAVVPLSYALTPITLSSVKTNVHEMSYFSQLATIKLIPEILYFPPALGCCNFELEFLKYSRTYMGRECTNNTNIAIFLYV